MPKPVLQPATTASEVLAGALEYWGEGGERWVKGTLSNGDSVCFYGALSAAAYGVGRGFQSFSLMSYGPTGDGLNWSKADRAYRKAQAYVHDELQAQGFGSDIAHFNDNSRRRFADVRAVACGALKRALDAEAKKAQPCVP